MNADKDISAFRKTWDILSPAVYYYAVYNVAFILLAFIMSLILDTSVGARLQSRNGYEAMMKVVLNSLAMLFGTLPLIPLLKGQLYRNKYLDAGPKANPAAYLVTAIIAFTSSVGLNILIILTGLVGKSESYKQVAERQYGVAFGVGLFIYGVISPVVEEIVFRGLIYNRMKKYYPIWLSVIVSALLFGAWHGNMVQALYGTCMGILIAYTYERFKNFKIPCIFHAIANISVYTITYNQGLYNAVVRSYNAVVLIGISIVLIVLIEKKLLNAILYGSEEV
ncbi:MAG: CPBP family intramembrane metalloprotease [Lachnospiraceae bacterium]|nr:CPBP family intramembrane metalloprotease [Lachnospiraceae bacterium]